MGENTIAKRLTEKHALYWNAILKYKVVANIYWNTLDHISLDLPFTDE